MSISESTALARAAAVKASFPKGKINVAQAKAMLLAMVDSQVGYASGSSSRSLYAERENWPEGSWSTNQREAQGYWCYRGISWSFAMCFGRAATIAGIGNQGHFPFPGWAATWLGMAWMKARGMGVSISNAQPGDLSFQSWGRTGNPTDHIEVVTGSLGGSYLAHTGFNTSSGSGSVTTGATVARVWRPSWPIKFIGRPNWNAIVATYNAGIIEESDELSAAEVKEIKDHIDKLRGERTAAHVKEIANQEAILRALADIRTKQDDLRNGINVVGRVAAEGRDNQPTVEEIVKGVYSDNAQGMSRDWWSRLGLVLDPEHRQYPADPGSLADFIIRTFEQVTGEVAEVYDGTRKRPIGPGNPHTEEQA